MFHFIARQKPVSAQVKNAKRLQDYKRRLSELARAAGVTLAAGEVYVRLLWFHSVPLTREDPDIDNILKPVLDALQGSAFSDDGVVARCTAARHDTSRQDLVLAQPDGREHPATSEIAALLLAADAEHILYVEVGKTSGQAVVLGPVDGVHA